MNRGIFLDRDGTIIKDFGYNPDPLKVELLPMAINALQSWKEDGWKLVLITNQSGVGRGLYTDADVKTVMDAFVNALKSNNVVLDSIYYCPHSPEENCKCRKPQPGLLLKGAEDLNIDLTASIMIGDKPSDVEAGQKAGTKTIFLGSMSIWPDHLPLPDGNATDLFSAVKIVQKMQTSC